MTSLLSQTTTVQAPGVRPRIVAGTVAAVLLALSSWGSAAIPQVFHRGLLPGLSLSRPGDYGSPLMATISVISFAVMLWAWWGLRRRELTVHDWLKVTALWSAPLLIAAPLQSRDLYSYAAQGMLWAEGLSPYINAVVDLRSDWVVSTSPVWLETPTPYGPFFMVLARLIAVASLGSLPIAIFLFRLLAVVSFIVVAWAVPVLARRLGLSEERINTAMWLGVVNPLMITQIVGGGHNDALIIALTMAALVAATSWTPYPVRTADGEYVVAARGRSLAIASAFVTVAAMVKVTAFVALPFVVLAWVIQTGAVNVRRIVGACVTAASWAAGIAVAASVITGLGFAWVIPVEGLEKGVSPGFTSAIGLAVAMIGRWLGHGPDWVEPAVSAAHTLGLLALALLLVTIFFLLAARLIRNEQDRLLITVESLVVALVALVVLAPTIRVWYALWFLPLAALVVTSRNWVTGMAIVSVVGTIMVLPDGNSALSEAFALPLAVLGVAASALMLTALPSWLERLRATTSARDRTLVPAGV